MDLRILRTIQEQTFRCETWEGWFTLISKIGLTAVTRQRALVYIKEQFERFVSEDVDLLIAGGNDSSFRMPNRLWKHQPKAV